MKQAYVKPVVTSVKLASDEAVLNGCKTHNFGGGATDYEPGSINCESGSAQCFVKAS